MPSAFPLRAGRWRFFWKKNITVSNHFYCLACAFLQGSTLTLVVAESSLVMFLTIMLAPVLVIPESKRITFGQSTNSLTYFGQHRVRQRVKTQEVDRIRVGLLVDSEIVSSTRYGKTRVFINKTLSTETTYQQDLINRDLLSTSLIVGNCTTRSCTSVDTVSNHIFPLCRCPYREVR